MSLTDLKKLADFSGTSVTDMYSTTVTPRALANDKLFYLDGNGSATFVFDDQNKFDGSGVAVINGSLDIQNSSDTIARSFSGLIYVTGNTILENHVQISGALISLGKVILSSGGSAGDHDETTVQFNQESLDTERQNVLNFREDQSAIRVFAGIAQR
jgi:phage baseplate assembly protein gpV